MPLKSAAVTRSALGGPKQPGTRLRQVGDAQHEADGVQDVGLAGAVEPGDGIEKGVEARHHRALGVALEAVHHNLLNVHGCELLVRRRQGERRRGGGCATRIAGDGGVRRGGGGLGAQRASTAAQRDRWSSLRALLLQLPKTRPHLLGRSSQKFKPGEGARPRSPPPLLSPPRQRGASHLSESVKCKCNAKKIFVISVLFARSGSAAATS